jgi:hypothetical protein
MGGFLQLKYAMAILIAFSIDALQFLLGIAIVGAFTVPGVAGAIMGCVISTSWVINTATACWIGGALGGVLHLAGDFFSGGALQAFLMAMGGGVAAIVDFCFTAIGLAIILPMLVVTNIVKPGQLFSYKRSPFMLLEIVPGADMFPFMTALVVVSIMEAEAESGRHPVLKGALGAATGTAMGALGAAKAGLAVASGERTAGQAYQRGQSARALVSQQSPSARAAHTPLVDRIQSASQNPNSVIAQNQRSAAPEQRTEYVPANASSPHVLNLAS